MTLDDVRRLALSLPEATEEPHFDMTSFRVRAKIFATVPAEGAVIHIFVGEGSVTESVAENPAGFAKLFWGKRLAGVRADLAEAGEREVGELLEEAWRRRAPRRLVAELDASRGSA